MNNIIHLLDALYQMTAESKRASAHARPPETSRIVKAKRLLKKLKNPRGATFDRWLDADLPTARYERPPAEGYFSGHRIAVYTSIFGAYDEVQNPLFQPDNVDYFIITDVEVPEGSPWKKLDSSSIIPDWITDSAMKNRYVKMMPHKIFPEYDYSVYIDGNVRLTSDATILTCTLEDFPVAMHRHRKRDCVYQEVEACLIKQKDSPERLTRHRDLLKSHHLPEHFGLLEASVIARRHNDAVCIKLMEDWWKAYSDASRRDQISLIDCVWMQGLSVDAIATLGDSVAENHHFLIAGHN